MRFVLNDLFGLIILLADAERSEAVQHGRTPALAAASLPVSNISREALWLWIKHDHVSKCSATFLFWDFIYEIMNLEYSSAACPHQNTRWRFCNELIQNHVCICCQAATSAGCSQYYSSKGGSQVKWSKKKMRTYADALCCCCAEFDRSVSFCPDRTTAAPRPPQQQSAIRDSTIYRRETPQMTECTQFNPPADPAEPDPAEPDPAEPKPGLKLTMTDDELWVYIPVSLLANGMLKVFVHQFCFHSSVFL